MPSLRTRPPQPSSTQATDKLLPSERQQTRQQPLGSASSGPQKTTVAASAAGPVPEPGRLRSFFQRSKSLRIPGRSSLHKTAGASTTPSASLGLHTASRIAVENRQQNAALTASSSTPTAARASVSCPPSRSSPTYPASSPEPRTPGPTQSPVAPLSSHHTHSPPSHPASPTEEPRTSETAQKMPQPLKKRPSIRDRFRRRSTPSTSAELSPEPRGHAVYVPTHAASDFSRLSVPPRRHEIFPIAEAPPPPRSSASPPPRDDLPSTARQPAPDPDPFSDPRTTAIPRAPDNAPNTAIPDSPSGPEPADAPSPSSDYQDFLTRAAAQDLAHRQQVWRALTAASRGARLPREDQADGGGGGSRSSRSASPDVDGGSSAPNYTHVGPALPPLAEDGRRTSFGRAPAARPTPIELGSQQQQQQPRGLKRQSSIAQRIAQYVRPAADDGR